VIGRLRGTIAERGLDGSCILEVNGVGYELFVPIGARLPAPPEVVTLHVHTHVREDALTLYGFASQDDRHAFRMLLTVSNVGPKIALAVMSGMNAKELAAAIATGDPKSFKGMPGVGKRTAERILLDLKDKLGIVGGYTLEPTTKVANTNATSPRAQVAAMMVSMGFKPAEAERAVQQIENIDDRSVESLLREALSKTS
jgi:holliday junction DNA helicase RuvA